ncbi:MAG: 4-(cytidine 5'-diphospho)-2-C-methyl-D-erythritol kinase [Sediminimonas sp.]|uniref:4-(cytidine 5'-diphospho)-2-C-methyl-D-erythritol kinase n=1 Tax=Sediminimonas sp. TaxID=2823379 RepID=UPI0028706257|nr:4-(cytidine 5'-diphospho)-2-C-methyl-D-erythritol kinase [Sediminimonas sp.]MDR9484517.1 4-(cytidine 5'-diphospho)-2-C-methyl-D-erythritol kinase [Sediminimonas sp.]
MATEVFAPAKVNLTLHITGRRDDGYHLLDSLVAFADVGDRLGVALSDAPHLAVTGPMAAGVPLGGDNLALRAARLMGADVRVTLDKHLPAAAGLGGGSSDAAACMRAVAALTGRPLPDAQAAAALGADVPVCLLARAARMRGIGEEVMPLASFPPLNAVLVNPGVAVPTGGVFARMTQASNAPMPALLPDWPDAAALIDWLAAQRNDLQDPAIALQPVIGDVLKAIGAQPGCGLARMSGSGATCFGLFKTQAAAQKAARALARPGWWVQAVTLS